jgi:activator of HSP90 ATPase
VMVQLGKFLCAFRCAVLEKATYDVGRICSATNKSGNASNNNGNVAVNATIEVPQNTNYETIYDLEATVPTLPV